MGVIIRTYILEWPDFTIMSEEEQIKEVLHSRKNLALIHSQIRHEVPHNLKYLEIDKEFTNKKDGLLVVYRNEPYGNMQARKVVEMFEDPEFPKYTYNWHAMLGDLMGYSTEQIRDFLKRNTSSQD